MLLCLWNVFVVISEVVYIVVQWYDLRMVFIWCGPCDMLHCNSVISYDYAFVRVMLPFVNGVPLILYMGGCVMAVFCEFAKRSSYVCVMLWLCMSLTLCVVLYGFVFFVVVLRFRANLNMTVWCCVCIRFLWFCCCKLCYVVLCVNRVWHLTWLCEVLVCVWYVQWCCMLWFGGLVYVESVVVWLCDIVILCCCHVVCVCCECVIVVSIFWLCAIVICVLCVSLLVLWLVLVWIWLCSVVIHVVFMMCISCLLLCYVIR